MPKTATGKVQRRLVAQAMTGTEQITAVSKPLPSKPQFLPLTSEIDIMGEKEQVDASRSPRGGMRQRVAKLLSVGPKKA